VFLLFKLTPPRYYALRTQRQNGLCTETTLCRLPLRSVNPYCPHISLHTVSFSCHALLWPVYSSACTSSHRNNGPSLEDHDLLKVYSRSSLAKAFLSKLFPYAKGARQVGGGAFFVLFSSRRNRCIGRTESLPFWWLFSSTLPVTRKSARGAGCVVAVHDIVVGIAT